MALYSTRFDLSIPQQVDEPLNSLNLLIRRQLPSLLSISLERRNRPRPILAKGDEVRWFEKAEFPFKQQALASGGGLVETCSSSNKEANQSRAETASILRHDFSSHPFLRTLASPAAGAPLHSLYGIYCMMAGSEAASGFLGGLPWDDIHVSLSSPT